MKNYTIRTVSVLCFFALFFASTQIYAQARIGGEIVLSESASSLKAVVKVNGINGAPYALGPSSLKFEYNASELRLPGAPRPGIDYNFASEFGVPYSNSISRPREGVVSINVFIFGGSGTILDTDLSDLVEINFEIVDPARFNLAGFDFTWTLCEHSDTDGSFSIDDCTGFGDVALPVELSSFNIESSERSIHLDWSTSTEENNTGFAVEYAFESGPFVEASFVEGSGTTTETKNYNYSLEEMLPGKYEIRLKQVDFDGKYSYSPVLEAVVGVPGEYLLDNAYPNPFNPQTTVNFAVRESQQVSYELYDSMGRLVQVLLNQTVEAGKNQEIRIVASDLPSGVYIGLLKGETFTASQRLVLAK